ncbi:MAG TPA: AIR synthase related protein, partial [Bacillota bacterium]|nr:AIR synthase related protein [Bacillota bacterium]
MNAKDEQPWRQLGLTEGEYERIRKDLGREPNLVELNIYSVMWSEHCSYKHSRAALRMLPVEGPHVLQGPGENAGVVDLGGGLGAAFKIESHNHPTAVEPFQGAATGAGGIIRDIVAMGARPAALLGSLRFGPLEDRRSRYLFERAVAGINWYAKETGIPVAGGEIYFEECYRGNPLVNAMCVGLLPVERLMRGRASGEGNLVLLAGALTGRDGIHGVTFASVELTAEIEEEERPPVQVGDAALGKALLEATLEVIEKDLAVGVQDLGGAGLTCAVTETAAR